MFPDFMTTTQYGGKVVSLTHRPPLPPGNTPGTHFCQSRSRPQGHSVTGRIMSMKNSNDTIGNGIRDLPVKGKAVPLQAWSGPECSRKLRFPDFMTTAEDGGKVVSLTHRPPLPPGNTPGTHFCQRLSRPRGHSATGRIMSLKNSNDTIENRNRDLPVCSAVPLPLRHRVPHTIVNNLHKVDNKYNNRIATDYEADN